MIHLIFIFMAMFIDFFLTSIGLKIGIIEESNNMLFWLFNLPFIQATAARLLITVLVLVPFIILYKKHPDSFKKAYSITYVIFAIVFALHANWIIQYALILI